MKSVAVLMSTYNGEQYLKEQMLSILNQENVDLSLFVRDDDSSDSTRDILERFCKETKKITVFFENNIGPALSFMETVKKVPDHFDYYAFADQDDIWKPDKLTNAVVKMLKSQSNYTLYASNQTIVDENGHIEGERFSFIPPLDVLNIVDKNYLSGCTMVITQELFRLLKNVFPARELLCSRMHDTWVAAVAATVGNIIYDEESYIYYRQHNNNVVGAKNPNVKDRIKAKLFTKKNLYHKLLADELLKLPQKR